MSDATLLASSQSVANTTNTLQEEIFQLKDVLRDIRMQHQRQFEVQEKAHEEEIEEIERRHKEQLQRHLRELAETHIPSSFITKSHLEQNGDAANNSEATSRLEMEVSQLRAELDSVRATHSAQVDGLKEAAMSQRGKHQRTVNELHEQYESLNLDVQHLHEREEVLNSALMAKDDELMAMQESMNLQLLQQRKKIEEGKQRMNELRSEMKRAKEANDKECRRLADEKANFRTQLTSANTRVVELEQALIASQSEARKLKTEAFAKTSKDAFSSTMASRSMLGSSTLYGGTGPVFPATLMDGTMGEDVFQKKRSMLLEAMSKERKTLQARIENLESDLTTTQHAKSALLRDEMQAREEIKMLYEKQLQEKAKKLDKQGDEIQALTSTLMFYEANISRCYVALLKSPSSTSMSHVFGGEHTTMNDSTRTTPVSQMRLLATMGATTTTTTPMEQLKVVVSEVQGLVGMVDSYQLRAEHMQSERDSLNEDVQRLEKEVRELRSQESVHETSSQDTTNRLRTLEAHVSSLESAKELLERDRTNLREKVQQLMMQNKQCMSNSESERVEMQQKMNHQLEVFELKMSDVEGRLSGKEGEAKIVGRERQLLLQEKDKIMQQAAESTLRAQLLSTDVRDLKARLEDMARNVEKANSVKDVVRERCKKLEVENSKLKNDIVSWDLKKMRLEEKVGVATEGNNHLQHQVNGLTGEKLRLEGENVSLQAKLQNMERKLDDTRTKLGHMQSSLANNYDLANELAEKNTLIEHLTVEIGSVKSKIARERDNFQCVRDDYERQVEVLSKKVQKLKGQAKLTQEQLGPLQTEVAHLNQANVTLKRNVDKKGVAVITLETQLRELEKKFKRAKSFAEEQEEQVKLLQKREQLLQQSTFLNHTQFQENMTHRFQQQLNSIRALHNYSDMGQKGANITSLSFMTTPYPVTPRATNTTNAVYANNNDLARNTHTPEEDGKRNDDIQNNNNTDAFDVESDGDDEDANDFGLGE
eukprot:m.68729 g.68729  ORF g.68729 m.68729 type:complete len:993 (-) comp8255_c0_seq1:235-3213(-)